MRLTGLSVALYKNHSCKFAQAGIGNAWKKAFQAEFTDIYQNLHLNLDAIL